MYPCNARVWNLIKVLKGFVKEVNCQVQVRIGVEEVVQAFFLVKRFLKSYPILEGDFEVLERSQLPEIFEQFLILYFPSIILTDV